MLLTLKYSYTRIMFITTSELPEKGEGLRQEKMNGREYAESWGTRWLFRHIHSTYP